MTLEGPSECSNWASKCPFTPKDTYGHCQHLTVAQNAGPVRPFPARPPHLARSARASSLPSGPHARPGRGRAFSPGGPGGAGLWVRATTRRRRALAPPCRQPSAPLGRRRGPVTTRARPGSFRALGPLLKPGPSRKVAPPATQSLRVPTLCASNIMTSKSRAPNCG